MKKNLTLGIFGFGCVGQGLYHVLNETHGIKATIKRICVKDREKKRSIDTSFFTFDACDILADPEIDVVVELIDDAKVAYEIVKAALQNGKAVVTANKKMLAENLESIRELQNRYQRPVLYEGAACASIPIIRNLEEYYDNDLINSIEGIFNGSTNYILTKIFEDRLTFRDALKQAQELGFAESNPELDVKAFDPKYKLAILIAHTFGVFVNPEHIVNFGIDNLSSEDIAIARNRNQTIKLIARAFKINGRIHGFVAPQYVDGSDHLAHVRNEFNAVKVKGAFAETQVFIGKGAGSDPTGSAVLSDISALTYDYGYEYKKLKQARDIHFSNELSVEVNATFKRGTGVRTNDFEELFKTSDIGDRYYLNGMVKLRTLADWAKAGDVSVVLPVDAKIG